MQNLVMKLPWRDVIDHDLTFLPCAISICAELRKQQQETSSIFEEYLTNFIPANYTNAMAVWWDENDNNEENGKEEDIDDAPPIFLTQAVPHIAKQIHTKRSILRRIHTKLAPSSLSFHSLIHASSICTSRAYSRRNPPPVSTDRVKLIGTIAKFDSTRFLPLIDIADHGGRFGSSNADVLHHKKNDEKNDNNYDDPFSASLVSTKPIPKGHEILVDYGGGLPLSNEHLLLDYGFVSQKNVDDDDVAVLSLQEHLLPSISSLSEYRLDMQSVKDIEKERIHILANYILDVNSSNGKKGKKRRRENDSSSSSPVVFESNGKPTLMTMALTLVLSCRGLNDVSRILDTVKEWELEQQTTLLESSTTDNNNNSQDEELLETLLLKIVHVATRNQKEFALQVLRKVSSTALLLEQQQQEKEEHIMKKNCDIQNDDNNNDNGQHDSCEDNESPPSSSTTKKTFNDIALEYCQARRDILKRASVFGT